MNRTSTALLSGKAALVTGASRGIGAATARTLHRDGAEVVLHYGSDRASAERLAESLGGRVHFVQADLFEPSAPEEVWSRTLEACPRVDVLVNNAGAWIPLTAGAGESVAHWLGEKPQAQSRCRS